MQLFKLKFFFIPISSDNYEYACSGTSQLITVDNLALHIASHYKNVEFAGDPRVNSLSFFLRLTQPIGVMRALIIFSYDDNLFYYDEFANDECINKRSFQSNSLRKICEYIRGTSLLSLKKMIVVDTTEISIGFFEHFGIR